MTTTTQDAFHVMRGHMHDGCTIAMRNGEVLTLKSVMQGWVLINGVDWVSPPTPSAAVISRLIAEYGEAA